MRNGRAAWALWAMASACSSRNQLVDDGGTVPAQPASAEAARCVTGETSWRVPRINDPLRTLRTLLRGAGQPVLVAREADLPDEAPYRWGDGSHVGEVRVAHSIVSAALAFTGEGYLMVSEHGAQWADALFENVRPLRGIVPNRSCDVSVAELPGHALVTWRARSSDRCDASVPTVLRVGPRGEPLGRPRELTTDDGPVQVTDLRARWDFGRIVVQGQDLQTAADTWWILDPTGEPLASGPGTSVACPRSGCVRVRAAPENGEPEGIPDDALLLRFEPLRGSTGSASTGTFTTNVSARDVKGLLVSGDRVMVLHSPAVGTQGCSLTVVDIARRQVMLDVTEAGVACDERSARPTPRGFAVAVYDPERGFGVEPIDCSR